MIMMKYQLAVFDMDGTVLNTLADLTDCVNYALALHGLPPRSEREIRSFTCRGLRRMTELALPDGADSRLADEVFHDFSRYYAEHCADRTAPYDGITGVLKELRSAGMKIAMVSNKDESAARKLCDRHLGGLLDYAAGAREGVRKKPSPEPIDAALSALGVRRSEAVCVGDSEVDVETAKNAGMDFIAVDWGFRGREDLLAAGASVIASDMGELARLILGGPE